MLADAGRLPPSIRPPPIIVESYCGGQGTAVPEPAGLYGPHAKGADMNVMIENGNSAGYKVNMAITFVLEEGEQPG
jgi:hypothetical protein